MGKNLYLPCNEWAYIEFSEKNCILVMAIAQRTHMYRCQSWQQVPLCSGTQLPMPVCSASQKEPLLARRKMHDVTVPYPACFLPHFKKLFRLVIRKRVFRLDVNNSAYTSNVADNSHSNPIRSCLIPKIFQPKISH